MRRVISIAWVVPVLIGACSEELGTPVDVDTLGYSSCHLEDTCAALNGDDTEAPELPEDGSGEESTVDAHPAEGRWVLVETQAVKTVDVPFVGVLETTSVHHYLVDLVWEGDGLWMEQELCELEIYEQSCHNIGITVIPQAYVEAIEPIRRKLRSVEFEPGGELTSERVTALRGAELADALNDPLPTQEDPTGAVDQDEDGHPGMTVLLDGVFAGARVFTAQRWWSEFSGTVVDANYVEGLLEHANETNTLGADPPALAYQTENVAHEETSRSFFRMVRVSAQWTCEDLIAAAYGDAPCAPNDPHSAECAMRRFDHLNGDEILCQ